MRLKKFIAIVMALTVAGSMFVGCSTGTEDKKETTTGKAEQTTDVKETGAVEIIKTDVIVIGAGGGGLSAAIEAHDAGANVILVEKMPFVGGNTARATGGINAAGTKFQEAAGITDNVEVHYEDTMKGGQDKNDPELVKFMTENGADAVHWLSDLGADLTDVGSLGGATNKRAHRPTGGAPVGDHIVNVLDKNVKDRGITTYLNTEATEVIVEDGKVVGVEAVQTGNGEEVTLRIEADAVVIAAGGFGNNAELYEEYQPSLEGFISTNQKGATGDGIILAEEAGADMVDLQEIQIHPTVHPETAALITEAVRGNGAIVVNTQGARFTNEMSTRDKVSAAILEQEGQHAYLVFDQGVRESLKAIEKYVKQGLVIEGETPAELAEALGMDATTLETTIATWNTAVSNKNDEIFGRESGMEISLEKAPYYAIEIAPGVHHTMGGIKINADAQVVDTEGVGITGLYAAGEVTGGVHGTERLGGNALADIVVFGREAGINAAAHAMADGGIGVVEKETTEEDNQPKVNPEATAQYKDGTYTGEGKANNGPIKVEVVVKDGYIDAINVLEHSETSSIFASVEAELIPSLIYSQTTEGVDAVSGASNSSSAVIEAVAAALETAK